MRSLGVLALCLVICLGVAATGGLLTSRAVPGWYAGLEKPSWTPPDRAFGPVWTVLYVMMAVAAWLVWKRTGLAGGRLPLGLFALQLALNAAWTPVFFGLKLPGAAFAVIVALWFAVGATTAAFWCQSLPAGALMVPYWAWVGFAMALNFAVWRLNA